MCKILNGLQKEGFQIKKERLGFIRKNRPTLEREGLLMPGRTRESERRIRSYE